MNLELIAPDGTPIIDVELDGCITATDDGITMQLNVSDAVLPAFLDAFPSPPVAGVLDAPPPAPAEPAPAEPKTELVGTTKLGKLTLEQMYASNWTDEQLLSHGYLEEVTVISDVEPVSESAPAAPNAPAAPQEPVDDITEPPLTELGKGATLSAFIENGWTVDQLVANNFLEKSKVAQANLYLGNASTMEPAKSDIEKPWPRQNEEGQWIDKNLVTYDPEKHSEVGDHKKAGHPVPKSVSADGSWKIKKRSSAAAKTTPAAPSAPDVNDTPPPPGAPATVDPELEALIKDFSKNASE